MRLTKLQTHAKQQAKLQFCIGLFQLYIFYSKRRIGNKKNSLQTPGPRTMLLYPLFHLKMCYQLNIPLAFYSGERIPHFKLKRRLDGHADRSRCFAEEKSLFTCRESNHDSSAVQPVAWSLYWGIPDREEVDMREVMGGTDYVTLQMTVTR